jgi:hypothetical protein
MLGIKPSRIEVTNPTRKPRRLGSNGVLSTKL